MSILAPVFSTYFADHLAARPDHFADLSVGILIVSMRGACSPSSARAAPIALTIHQEYASAFARLIEARPRMISSVMPVILMSICSEVTPDSVPAP